MTPGEAGKNRNGRRRPPEMSEPTTVTDYQEPANYHKIINNQTNTLKQKNRESESDKKEDEPTTKTNDTVRTIQKRKSLQPNTLN
jgi:hypothetical protein